MRWAERSIRPNSNPKSNRALPVARREPRRRSALARSSWETDNRDLAGSTIAREAAASLSGSIRGHRPAAPDSQSPGDPAFRRNRPPKPPGASRGRPRNPAPARADRPAKRKLDRLAGSGFPPADSATGAPRPAALALVSGFAAEDGLAAARMAVRSLRQSGAAMQPIHQLAAALPR